LLLEVPSSPWLAQLRELCKRVKGMPPAGPVSKTTVSSETATSTFSLATHRGDSSERQTWQATRPEASSHSAHHAAAGGQDASGRHDKAAPRRILAGGVPGRVPERVAGSCAQLYD